MRHTPGRDYAYRTELPRAVIAHALAVTAIAYPNFKNAVAESDRHDAYLEAWSALRDLQQARACSRRR